MKEKILSWLRPSRKWSDMFLITAVLAIVMIYGGDFVMLGLFEILPLNDLLNLIPASESVIDFLYLYVIFVGVWITFFLICGIPKGNRPIIKRLAPNENGNNLKGALVGLLVGCGLNGFCILMSVLLGDISLSFSEFNPVLLFIFLFSVFIQSGAEELVTRGYMYQKLRRRYVMPAVAIVGNTVLFGALHLFNPGITPLSMLIIIESGVLFTFVVYYYDSLWGAMMMHTGWNYTQNIVFGLPNSGIVSEYSLFKLDAASAQDGLFYSAIFGVEGSLGALLVLTAAIIAVVLINRGKPEKVDMWKELAEEKEAQMREVAAAEAATAEVSAAEAAATAEEAAAAEAAAETQPSETAAIKDELEIKSAAEAEHERSSTPCSPTLP